MKREAERDQEKTKEFLCLSFDLKIGCVWSKEEAAGILHI